MRRARSYHLHMSVPGELLVKRRLGAPDLDRIDDELFSTDYRSPTQTRHLTLLPEPPTVRLAQREPTVTWRTGTLEWPEYAPVSSAEDGGWPTVTYRAASPYTEDENGTEIVVIIGLAVLLVVAVASTGVLLFWFV